MEVQLVCLARTRGIPCHEDVALETASKPRLQPAKTTMPLCPLDCAGYGLACQRRQGFQRYAKWFPSSLLCSSRELLRGMLAEEIAAVQAGPRPPAQSLGWSWGNRQCCARHPGASSWAAWPPPVWKSAWSQWASTLVERSSSINRRALIVFAEHCQVWMIQQLQQ